MTAASRAGVYTIAVCTAYTPPGLTQGAHFAVNSLVEVSRALRGRTFARAARPQPPVRGRPHGVGHNGGHGF